MNNELTLELISKKLENNINTIVIGDIDKISLGFIINNLFGSTYFYDIINTCLIYDILLTDEELQQVNTIFNTRDYGRYCFK